MNIKDIQNTAQYTELVYEYLIKCRREMERELDGVTRPVEIGVRSVGVNHVLEQQLRETRENEVSLPVR